MTPELLQRARRIRLFVMDVDGILTDGRLYYSSNGDECKPFHIRDGLGIKWLQRAGIDAAIITGRRSPAVERRAAELGIRHLHQGHEDKREAFRRLLEDTGLTAAETAYIGDDLPDLPLLHQAGLALTVADADPRLCQAAHWISSRPGGHGAVREAAEMILTAQNRLAELLAGYNA